MERARIVPVVRILPDEGKIFQDASGLARGVHVPSVAEGYRPMCPGQKRRSPVRAASAATGRTGKPSLMEASR
jgi:hypothetical protein